LFVSYGFCDGGEVEQVLVERVLSIRVACLDSYTSVALVRSSLG